MSTKRAPYKNVPISKWENVTEQLIQNHPLDENEIVSVVFNAWDAIMQTKIGNRLQIGVDVFPSPQIMGNYLHMLIATLLSDRYPTDWRRESDKSDKDVVYS